jgi:hypothetical protein
MIITRRAILGAGEFLLGYGVLWLINLLVPQLFQSETVCVPALSGVGVPETK